MPFDVLTTGRPAYALSLTVRCFHSYYVECVIFHIRATGVNSILSLSTATVTYVKPACSGTSPGMCHAQLDDKGNTCTYSLYRFHFYLVTVLTYYEDYKSRSFSFCSSGILVSLAPCYGSMVCLTLLLSVLPAYVLTVY